MCETRCVVWDQRHDRPLPPPPFISCRSVPSCRLFSLSFIFIFNSGSKDSSKRSAVHPGWGDLRREPKDHRPKGPLARRRPQLHWIPCRCDADKLPQKVPHPAIRGASRLPATILTTMCSDLVVIPMVVTLTKPRRAHPKKGLIAHRPAGYPAPSTPCIHTYSLAQAQNTPRSLVRELWVCRGSRGEKRK